MLLQDKYFFGRDPRAGYKKRRCWGFDIANSRISSGFLLVVLMIWGALSTTVSAKSDGEGNKAIPEHDKEPETEMAVIFLGPSPARRYSRSARGGEYAMLLPEIDEVPPARLFFRDTNSMKGGQPWRSLNVSFNNPLPMSRVPADRSIWLYRKNTRAGTYERYVLIPPASKGERRVVFLTPSSRGLKRWRSSPIVKAISVNAFERSAGRIMLKNLSNTTVLHAFGKTVSMVAPQETIVHRQGEAGVSYRLAASYGRQKKMIYDTAMRFDVYRGVHLFVLYDADPKTNAGRKVGLFRMTVECADTPANESSLKVE